MILSNLTLLVIFSIMYILGVIYIYFSKERVNNDENKIYKLMLISNFVGLILQFLCDFVSFQYLNIPKIISNIVLKLYLIYFIFWAICMLNYLLTISFNKPKKIISFTYIVFVILSIILVLSPQNLYRDPINRIYYTYGIAPQVVYLSSFIISSVVGLILIFKRKDVIKKKTMPIYLFILFGVISMTIQIFRPELVITACMESLICCLMYFTIENPDVKMLRQMELAKNQAEKANRAKSDFLSSMSHEIRTPLNAIVGLSEDITTYEEQVPKEVIEDIKDIQNASQTLLEIVGNILDINKIESEKMEIIENTYKFKEEITKLCKVTSTRIGDKPIKFNLNIADDIPYELIGDKGKVKEIVNNLLTNAIKYTEQGEVNLTIKCINDINKNISNLIITCQDTGRGIKAENISKLFTKFDRLDVDRNTTTEGTGLGLAITKSLVEMMGGKINVQSQFGKGSIFVVQIPQKIGKLVTTEEIIEENKIDDNYGHKKILIVDDNVLNIKVAKRALSTFDFEIDEAKSGEECINKVNNNNYDLILMDIMMPYMNGEQTLQKLKENPNFTTPVIALTADALTGSKEKYIEKGFNDYISKPFSREQIKEKLNLIFSKKLYSNKEDIWADAPKYVVAGKDNDF